MFKILRLVAAANALLSASWYAPAFGIPCAASDALQLGSQSVVSIWSP